MKVRCLIIDDEYWARQYLKEYVQKIPLLELIGDYSSPLKAIDLIKSGHIDLIFLDIQMPDITGLEFLKTLSNAPKVILTTAYKEYALEAYELNVIDYLLKPFSFERFIKAVNKVIATNETPIKEEQHSENTEPRTSLHDSYMIIRADRKLNKINFVDLIYIEGQKAYVTFHTLKKKITALASLKDLEDKLPSRKFIRIHKSYIISIDRIESLDGNLIEVGNISLPVGHSYRKDVAKLFGAYE